MDTNQYAEATNIYIYYINTNEIPSELSSHVKITCYLHVWKYHHCYGFIINRAFQTKKLFKENGLAFHWFLYNKWNTTWLRGDTKFLFSCWKRYFTHSPRSLVKYFSTLTEKFRISARPCNILSLYMYIYIYIYIYIFFLAGTYVQLRHHCGRAEKHVVSPIRDFAIRLITAWYIHGNDDILLLRSGY